MHKKDDYGCGHCWPDSAEAAWKFCVRLKENRVFLEESHCRVALRQCHKCGQSFLYVFTETIDWVNGEDPQYRSLLPLTEDEVSHFAKSEFTEETLRGLRVPRYCLQRDLPDSDPPRVYWSAGFYARHHD
ncbi:MAG: hypothetical protein QM758_12690 [Armatimonas sp.]